MSQWHISVVNLCPVECVWLIRNSHHFELMLVVVLLTGRVMATSSKSGVLLGMQKRRLEFTPLDELAVNTDFE